MIEPPNLLASWIERGRDLQKLGRRIHWQRKRLAHYKIALRLMIYEHITVEKKRRETEQYVLQMRNQVKRLISHMAVIKKDNERLKDRNHELEVLHHLTTEPQQMDEV